MTRIIKSVRLNYVRVGLYGTCNILKEKNINSVAKMLAKPANQVAEQKIDDTTKTGSGSHPHAKGL